MQCFKFHCTCTVLEGFFSCKVIQWRKRPRILADPIPTTLKFFAGTVVLLSFSKNTLRMWAWDKQAQSPTDNIVQYVRNGFLLGRYFVLYSCIYFLFNETSLKKPKKEYYLVSIMGKCFFKAQLLITSFTFSTFTKSIYRKNVIKSRTLKRATLK